MTSRLVVLALALWVAPAAAQAPPPTQAPPPSQTYAGGTRVDSSSVGVSFVIPQGWVGRFGQDGNPHLMVLSSNSIEGVGIAVVESGTTATQVYASLNESPDLGNGVVLRPTGPPTTRGSRMAARYQSDAYVGFALALLGPTQNSVIFFFAGPPANQKAYLSLLGDLGESTSFLQPAPAMAQAPPQLQPPPQPRASSGLDPAWAKRLAGQDLYYFSSYSSGYGGGGMSSQRVLRLCADGSFTQSGSSLVTMTVPGASGASGGRRGDRGRWSLESPTPTTALLVLALEGGQVVRWKVQYEDNNYNNNTGKIFLNGTHWMRERSKSCG